MCVIISFCISFSFLSCFFINRLLSVVGGGKQLSGMVAGDRTDNKWLQYNSTSLPRTQQDWDGCVFVEKTHWGYYCWPRFSFKHYFTVFIWFAGLLLAVIYQFFLYLSNNSLFLFTITSLLFSRKLSIYAPLEEQPKQNLTRDEMTEVCAQSYTTS